MPAVRVCGKHRRRYLIPGRCPECYDPRAWADNRTLRRKLKRQVYDRQRGLCAAALDGAQHVLAPGWELHHIVPRVEGGSDDLANLVGLCSPCHKALEKARV